MSDLTPLSGWLVEKPETVVAVRGIERISSQVFISRVNAWISKLQPRPGNRWAVYHDDSFEFLAILNALWQLKRTACIPSDNRPGTVARLEASVDGFIGEFPASTEALDNPDANAQVDREPIIPASDFIALEIYTSGSTGDPRPITKTVSQLERELEVLESQWPSESGSVVLSTVSHQHLYGMTFALFWPFSSGRAFECERCELTEDIVYKAQHYQRFSLVSSPSHLSRFNPSLDWGVIASGCNSVVSSAAPLAIEDSQAVGRILNTEVREIYGSSETGAVAWRVQTDSLSDALWQALPGVLLEPSAEGSLVVRSSYLGELEQFILPDKVEFSDPHSFRLAGRMDRIVKIEGKRVSLSAIEALLLNHDWVKNVKALAIERARIETAIVMQLSREGVKQLRASDRKTMIKIFRGILADHLESVVLPRRWRFVEAMPFNQQGKLPLQSLQVLFESDHLDLPRVISQEAVDGSVILQCYISPRLNYFDGHMPGRPILPGIVQVHWAEAYGRQLLVVTGRFERLEAIKFKQVILPRTEVRLRLDFNVETRKLDFIYDSDKGVHSSGRICFVA
jgi:3-hydroxymyristoyl/3-hydroxydecanoyl-(acyl carrier protein) dehydratase